MTLRDPLTYDGTTQAIGEWALDYGIPPAVIVARLERGLSVEQAITSPMVTAPGQRLKDKSFERYIGATYPPNVSLLSHAGKTMTISAWARHLGIRTATLRCRLDDGWSVERTLTTPVARRRKRSTTQGQGVVGDFEGQKGTGAGGTAQETPEIDFSEQANSV